MIEKRLKTKYRDLKVTFSQAEGISEEEARQNLERVYDLILKYMRKTDDDPKTL